MLDSIINAFLEFKWFMLLNVGLTIAAGIVLWFATEQFGYQKKNRYLFAFFMGDSVDRLCLDTVCLRSVFGHSGRGDESGLSYIPSAAGSGKVCAVPGSEAAAGGPGQCRAFISGAAGRVCHAGLLKDHPL